MKDLEQLSYFLGLEVTSNSLGYYLSHAKYATDFLSCVGLIDTKTATTPIKANAKFDANNRTALSNPTFY